MTEAQEIIARLETERHRLMLKHAQLGEEATRLAYAVLTSRSASVRSFKTCCCSF